MSVKPQEIVVVGLRLRALRTIRLTGTGAMAIAAALVLLGPGWLAGLSVVAGGAVVSLFLLNKTAAGIERLTRLSRDRQSRIWDRYRQDGAFASRVRAALAGSGLSVAIADVTREGSATAALDGDATADGTPPGAAHGQLWSDGS